MLAFKLASSALVTDNLYHLRFLSLAVGELLLQQGLHETLLAWKRHGLTQALHDLGLKAINAAALFKILRGVAVERAAPDYLKCPAGYSAMFLPEPMIREFAKDPENEMSESFVEEALAKGDQCYGICENGNLAAYGWYSFRPTRIDPPDLRLRFSGDYVYMYKGYTHAGYRGRRLHAIGMTRALDHYLSQGFKGLVSYVESNNIDSLKSVFRMGYFHFGSVYVMKIGDRCLYYASRGCDRFGFEVEQAPEETPKAKRPAPESRPAGADEDPSRPRESRPDAGAWK